MAFDTAEATRRLFLRTILCSFTVRLAATPTRPSHSLCSQPQVQPTPSMVGFRNLYARSFVGDPVRFLQNISWGSLEDLPKISTGPVRSTCEISFFARFECKMPPKDLCVCRICCLTRWKPFACSSVGSDCCCGFDYLGLLGTLMHIELRGKAVEESDLQASSMCPSTIGPVAFSKSSCKPIKSKCQSDSVQPTSLDSEIKIISTPWIQHS